MVLTEEEKKERHRLANKRYYERLKTKKATKQLEKNSYNTSFSHARNFISKKAKRKDLPILRELIAQRQIELKKEGNEKENKKFKKSIDYPRLG